MKSRRKAPTPERDVSVLQAKRKARRIVSYKKKPKRFMANYVMRVESE